MKKTFAALTEGDEIYFIRYGMFFKRVTTSVKKTRSCLQIQTEYKYYNVPLNHMGANRVKVGNAMLYLTKKQFKRDVVKRLNELTK